MIKPRAVIFDCDGVLMDSWVGTMYFYNEVRRGLGLAKLAPEEEARAFVLPVAHALRELYPRDRVQEVFELAARIPEHDVLAHMRPMPGARECLELLRGHGVSLAVLTNGGHEARRVLEQHGLLELVHMTVTVEDMARPKPDPGGALDILRRFEVEPGQAAYVGDSSVDAATARGAGVSFWSFGPGGLEADLHVPDFATLNRYLTMLFQG